MESHHAIKGKTHYFDWAMLDFIHEIFAVSFPMKMEVKKITIQ